MRAVRPITANPFIWIRDNPLGLTPTKLGEIRATRHLTDLDIGRLAYRALMRAGHRYSGELGYLSEAYVTALPSMSAWAFPVLRKGLEAVGIRIGDKVRPKVYVPTPEMAEAMMNGRLQ